MNYMSLSTHSTHTHTKATSKVIYCSGCFWETIQKKNKTLYLRHTLQIELYTIISKTMSTMFFQSIENHLSHQQGYSCGYLYYRVDNVYIIFSF